MISRARPKSQILATRPSDMSTFLAAKSRWMHWGEESTTETQPTSPTNSLQARPVTETAQGQGEHALLEKPL